MLFSNLLSFAEFLREFKYVEEDIKIFLRSEMKIFQLLGNNLDFWNARRKIDNFEFCQIKITF